MWRSTGCERDCGVGAGGQEAGESGTSNPLLNGDRRQGENTTPSEELCISGSRLSKLEF